MKKLLEIMLIENKIINSLVKINIEQFNDKKKILLNLNKYLKFILTEKM